MLDKVSEFFKELKDRSSSPLFSSFAISWLITNWKVPVILLKYDSKDFSEMKMKGAIDYIMHLDFPWYQLWLVPAGSAILYTFGYPYLKNFISAFNAKRRKEGSNAVLKHSENGSISINRYLTLRDDYLKRTKQLEAIIKEESITQERLRQSEIKLSEEVIQKSEYERLNSSQANEIDKLSQSLRTLEERNLLLASTRAALVPVAGEWLVTQENDTERMIAITEDSIVNLFDGGIEKENIVMAQLNTDTQSLKIVTSGPRIKYYEFIIEDLVFRTMRGTIDRSYSAIFTRN